MNKYNELADLKKYYPDFNEYLFEKMDDEELTLFARNFYKTHLPVDVTTWIRVNEPEERLLYKDELGLQVCFIRDEITRNMFYKCENMDINGAYDNKRYEDFQPMVIGTHTSKLVLLPVMEITLGSVGVNIIFRNNFYDWCVSIESESEINCDFKGLITNLKGYFEGFPENRIYDAYSKTNKNNFSFCIEGNYNLYTFMFLLRDYLYPDYKKLLK